MRRFILQMVIIYIGLPYYRVIIQSVGSAAPSAATGRNIGRNIGHNIRRNRKHGYAATDQRR